MSEVKHRVLSGVTDENIATQTAAVTLLDALQGQCWVKSTPCLSLTLPYESRELLPMIRSISGSFFDAHNY